ncbi:MAG: response regulator [Verrucomicrobia bacterium]|nr:response regulator [Verrucomicrobiota bacterium]
MLVLSPDPNVHLLVGEALKGTGCDMRIAPSGAEGVKLARELRPALITLDASRPTADGWSVMGQLKSDPELAPIPVILLALKDGQVDAGFTLGAAEFLTKPVESELLSRVLHRHLHYPPEGYVLLVEDDPTLREMMSRIIENEKFPVTVAENGLRALELVKQTIPQLIVLDIMMPVMDGFQFLGELRQRKEWAHIPVVVLTAKTLSPEEREFLAARTDRVLQKGASVRGDVMANIRRHLTKSP